MIRGSHLNKRPACFHDVQCSLDGRFCATSVNGDVDGIRPASFLKPKLFHHGVSTALGVFHLALIWVASRREENISSRVVFRELESRGHDVDPDHSGSAEGFCDRHAKETHGTSPPYGDGLGSAEVRDVGDCMDCNGKGLNLRSELASGRRREGMKEPTIAASSKVILSGMRYETPAGRR